MSEEKIIIESNNLVSSLLGLTTFTDHQLSYIETITLEDVNALSGLIASIKALAVVHADHIKEYLEEIERGK